MLCLAYPWFVSAIKLSPWLIHLPETFFPQKSTYLTSLSANLYSSVISSIKNGNMSVSTTPCHALLFLQSVHIVNQYIMYLFVNSLPSLLEHKFHGDMSALPLFWPQHLEQYLIHNRCSVNGSRCFIFHAFSICCNASVLKLDHPNKLSWNECDWSKGLSHAWLDHILQIPLIFVVISEWKAHSDWIKKFQQSSSEQG